MLLGVLARVGMRCYEILMADMRHERTLYRALKADLCGCDNAASNDVRNTTASGTLADWISASNPSATRPRFRQISVSLAERYRA